MQYERLEEMRNLILDKLKVTIKKKLEITGEKRGTDDEVEVNAQSKARINSPPSSKTG